MRHYDRTANLFLKRTGFYADCTVGELYDESGNRICHTLEPPYRPSGERTVVGNTAIPNGIYPLKMEYDTALRYKCLRAADVRGFKNIRLCFLTKAQATANQTKGNILLGSRVAEEEGRLDDCITAFEKLNEYYGIWPTPSIPGRGLSPCCPCAAPWRVCSPIGAVICVPFA